MQIEVIDHKVAFFQRVYAYKLVEKKSTVFWCRFAYKTLM